MALNVKIVQMQFRFFFPLKKAQQIHFYLFLQSPNCVSHSSNKKSHFQVRGMLHLQFSKEMQRKKKRHEQTFDTVNAKGKNKEIHLMWGEN